MRFPACFALLLAAAVPAIHGADATLQEIRTVYLLPMSSGLDQYLANRLTRAGQLQVVTDPQLADAVFTDRIGVSFEERLAELYPRTIDTADDEKKTETAAAAVPSGRASSWGRGNGNFFLVDRKSRRVIWSYHYVPKNSRPAELNRVADRVADKLYDEARKK